VYTSIYLLTYLLTEFNFTRSRDSPLCKGHGVITFGLNFLLQNRVCGFVLGLDSIEPLNGSGTTADLYIYILDAVLPIHVVSNHDKLTTQNGGTFTN